MLDDGDDDFLAPAAPWAVTSKSTSNTVEDSTGDIFSHRNKFDSIAQDRLEYEKQKAAKVQAKQGKGQQGIREKSADRERQGSIKRESVDAVEKGSLKRRRIDAKDSARLLASIGLSGDRSVIAIDDSDEEVAQQAALPVRRSPRTNRTSDVFSPTKSRSKLQIAKDTRTPLAGDMTVTNIVAPAAPPAPVEEEEEDSDPEIAALTRKAQENARRKQELAKNASPPNEEGIQDGTQLATVQPADPIIELFITSRIPATKELLVRRKLSQNLAIVRETWCNKQGFSKPFSDNVFFTYRGRRLYDSTTVQRLGIAVDDCGRLYREDDPTKEGVHQVHILAVTAESFQESKEQKALQEKIRQAKLASAEYSEEPEAGANEATYKPPRRAIRLTVKAKDKPDFKVEVFHTTRIQKIIKTAKKTFGFAPEQEVYIKTCEDEELNPEGLVGDTEIDDMDSLDMFLRN